MSQQPGRGVRSFLPGRYAFVILILLLFVLLIPFMGAGTLSTRVMNVVIVVTLVASVRAVWPSRPAFYAAAVFGLVSLLPFLGVLAPAGPTSVVTHGASLLLLVLVMAAILTHVLTTEYVTLDTVLGAAAVYVLIGLLWASLYSLLEYSHPGSLRYPPTPSGGAASSLVPLLQDALVLYYSFETLTTLGVGDVVPVTATARFCSVSEALVGQLYMAVLVARFVGLQVSQSLAKREGVGGG